MPSSFLRTVAIIALFLAETLVAAQTQVALTLEQCHERAVRNYPLIQQKDLLARSLEFTIANAQSGNLPQVAVFAQATYQSDVTRLPGGTQLVEPLAKDQYKVYAELNQSIYDGGTIKNQNAVQTSGTLVEQQKVEVELYKIKDRINQIFFGALLMDAQLIQVNLLKADLLLSLSKTESAVRNGTAFRSNVDILQAEMLRADQRIIEIRAGKRTYLDMLGYFINQQLGDQTVLEAPVESINDTFLEIKRPELTLYQFQTELLGAQYKASNTRNAPRLGLFVQGGYGRPAFNFLKNEFETYYIGGVRFSWPLGGMYNSRRDRQLLDVNTLMVKTQKEAFLFNTNLSLRQQGQEVEKLKQLIRVDSEIIALRARIKTTAQSQHENGVISTSDLLREINAEETARQSLIQHEIQLMLARYNYKTISGNP
ncbi:MAG: TolC family protein [Cytophagales bacterium]|nr:TolC family protein [Cytophagales bacterium]